MRLRPSLLLAASLFVGVFWSWARGQDIAPAPAAPLQLNLTTPSPDSPKEKLIQKIFDLVTIYFSHDQVAQALELTSFDIRRGFDATSIITDVGQTMQFVLSPQQLRGIIRAYRGMATDLGSDAAATSVLRRAQLVLVVTNQPVIAQLRQAILTSSDPPSNTVVYEAALPLLTADRVRRVLSFIHQALAPNEWRSLINRFSPIVRFDLYPNV